MKLICAACANKKQAFKLFSHILKCICKYKKCLVPYHHISVVAAMEKVTILAVCNLFWFLPSTILFILIHKYIQKKAPVWQSILDLLLLDRLKVMILSNIIIISFIYIGVFYGELKPIVATVFLGFSTSFISMIIIMQEIILILKALIIFKPGILTDQPDQKVIRLFRQSFLFCCCARFIVDYFLQANRPCCSLTLELLTGTKMQS